MKSVARNTSLRVIASSMSSLIGGIGDRETDLSPLSDRNPHSDVARVTTITRWRMKTP